MLEKLRTPDGEKISDGAGDCVHHRTDGRLTRHV